MRASLSMMLRAASHRLHLKHDNEHESDHSTDHPRHRGHRQGGAAGSGWSGRQGNPGPDRSRSADIPFDWEDRETLVGGARRRLPPPSSCTPPTSAIPVRERRFGPSVTWQVAVGVRRLVLLSARGETQAESGRDRGA